MKYITANSISTKEFSKEPFKVYDSIENVLMDFQNAKKFYVFEIEENINLFKKTLYNTKSMSNLFKNYYCDSEKKLIKIVRKVPISELLSNEKATVDYFYNYTESNSDELQKSHSKNSLNKIIKFLIENNSKNRIEPDLLISLCVKLHNLPEESIETIEEYIINNYCSTEMLIRFANTIENCNVNKIAEAIARNDKTSHCMNLLDNLKKIENKNLTFDCIEDIIISKDKNGKLIYELANIYNDECNIDKLSKAIVNIDKYGYTSYLFATNIKGINKKFFEEAIAKKDTIGTYCINLASGEGFNNELLLKRVLELDKNGSMVVEFIKKASSCNLEMALDYLLSINASHKCIIEFANLTNGYGADKLIDYIYNSDTEGKSSFLFALTVSNANIDKLKEKIESINNPELFHNLFVSNLTINNKSLYISQISKIDTNGEIIKLIIENNLKKLSEEDIERLSSFTKPTSTSLFSTYDSI